MKTNLKSTQATDAAGLHSFLSVVNAAPMLSADEELALARRFCTRRDPIAAETLVVAHLRLVVRVARGYLGYGLDFADLIQEGTFGLMTAVKRFDPERGVRLAAFAVHFIRARIHEFVLRNWRIVKVATTKAQRKLFFNLRGLKHESGRLQRDDVERIATTLDVSPADVETMDARLYSIDAAVEPCDVNDDSRAGAFVLRAVDDAESDPCAECEAIEESARRSEALLGGLHTLDARSRDVIRRRWLQDDRETLSEIGERYGISKERVRQIEEKALARLRDVVQFDRAA